MIQCSEQKRGCNISHIITIDVKFRDLEALRRAFTRMGGTWREGQQTHAWYGQYLGDSVVPQEYQIKDPKTFGICDHAVSFPKASYEVGIVKEGGEYRVVWDFWGPGGLEKYMGTPATTRLKQLYAVEAVKLIAERKGESYTWSEEIKEDGTMILEARQY